MLYYRLDSSDALSNDADVSQLPADRPRERAICFLELARYERNVLVYENSMKKAQVNKRKVFLLFTHA